MFKALSFLQKNLVCSTPVPVLVVRLAEDRPQASATGNVPPVGAEDNDDQDLPTQSDSCLKLLWKFRL